LGVERRGARLAREHPLTPEPAREIAQGGRHVVVWCIPFACLSSRLGGVRGMRRPRQRNTSARPTGHPILDAEASDLRVASRRGELLALAERVTASFYPSSSSSAFASTRSRVSKPSVNEA